MSQLRSIPPDADPGVVSLIDARLREIESVEQVSILLAVESGSRAWGFASPDSDYDCRFFFVRPAREYADLWPRRDVIETPIDGLLDLSGWDVAKAIRLAVRGNATVGEWLRSPWVYSGESAFRDDLLALVDAITDRAAVRRHYLHVGRDQWARALHYSDGQGGASTARGTGVVQLKKVFYAIRPAVTLRWLDAHAGTPPMNLDDLLRESEVPSPVRGDIERLRELKALTREMGDAEVPSALAQWLADVLQAGRAAHPDRPGDPDVSVPHSYLRARANEGFLAVLDRWAP